VLKTELTINDIWTSFYLIIIMLKYKFVFIYKSNMCVIYKIIKNYQELLRIIKNYQELSKIIATHIIHLYYLINF